jgi:hypothetical protein
MLRNLRNRIRYLMDRAFAREFLGQFLLLASLIVSVTLLGMSAAFFGLFSADNAEALGMPADQGGNFRDAFWWSLNQLFRVMGVKNIYGSTGVLLAYSLLLSMMGLVVFSLLISMINNSMARRFDALRRGDTPVLERGHVLVLGWSNKVHSVVRQIAELAPGSKIVVLAPVDVEQMRESLRVNGVDREKATIILRSGSISTWSELQRVAVTSARSVMMLSTDGDDSETIKAMVLLVGFKDWHHSAPTLTAEIAREQNFELARIAARGRVHVVSSSTVISKILVQTVRNPGLATVYSELMSRSGNNIYVQQVAGCSGATMESIAHGFPDAIPVGVTWEETSDQGVRHAVALNPEPDYDFDDNDKLVLMSRTYPVRYQADSEDRGSLEIEEIPQSHIGVPERILMIGWSGIASDILREMNAHAISGTEIDLLVPTELARVNAERQLAEANYGMLKVAVGSGDATLEATYARTPPASYQCILILADEADGDEADTRTLRRLLRLSELRRYDEIRAHTVVELTDASNRDLLADLGVDDIVVSSEIVSAQIAQVGEQPVLGPIYRELLSAGGIEISIRPICEYADTNGSVSFGELTRAAQQRLEIVLGVYLADEAAINLNPGTSARWQFSNADQIVVMAQQVY